MGQIFKARLLDSKKRVVSVPRRAALERYGVVESGAVRQHVCRLVLQSISLVAEKLSFEAWSGPGVGGGGGVILCSSVRQALDLSLPNLLVGQG